MDYLQMFKKGGMGALTFIVSTIASVLIANPGLLTNLIPQDIAQMTVGTAAGAIIVMFANWLKNRNVPKGQPQL